MADKKIIVTDSRVYGKDTSVTPQKKKNNAKFYIKNRSERKVIKKSFKYKFNRFRESFSNWLHTKNATRLLIFAIVVIIAVSGVLIWGAITKEKPSKFFMPEVKATINEIIDGVNNQNETILNLGELEGKNNKEKAKHYSSFTLVARENASTIGFNNLYFVAYSLIEAEYDFILTLSHSGLENPWIFKRSLKFQADNFHQFNIPIRKALKGPNNTTTLKIEFIAKGNSSKIAISQMLFVS